MTCAPHPLPVLGRVRSNEETDDEAIKVQRGTDHRHPEGTGSRDGDGRCVPEARRELCDLLKWKARYGGLEVSDARRLKALEDENAKLKKLLAEAMLDNAILKDVAAKKW